MYICFQANFILVYDSTMASLKDILSKTHTFRKLARARCLECVGEIAGAVGKETFLSDSVLVSSFRHLYLLIPR